MPFTRNNPIFDALALSADKAEDVETDNKPMNYDSYFKTDIRHKVAGTIDAWAALESPENPASMLQGMLLEVSGVDTEGEGEGALDEDEADYLKLVYETAYDYLALKGVYPDDITAILEEGDEEVAVRVQEMIEESTETQPDSDDFAFGGAGKDNDAVFDSLYDALFRPKVVIRNGIKEKIMKHVSGFIRRTSEQKAAMKKALSKSHSGAAMLKRRKSFMLGKKMGLHKLRAGRPHDL